MRSTRRYLPHALTIVVVVSAFDAVQDTQRVAGIGWIPLFFFDLPKWGAWVVLAPAIILLARRFPLLDGRARWRLPLHAAAGLLASCTAVTLMCLGRYVVARAAVGAGLLTAPAQQAYVATALDLQRTVPGVVRVSFLYPVLFYFCVVAMYHAVAYARAYHTRRAREAELQTSLAHAELQALKLQLQPHFLFNTLHTISALMERDAEAARSVMAQLSDLLRYSLRGVNEHEASLEAELDVLRTYVCIQEARFNERLVVEYAVAPSIGDVLVPRMLLQPLVENAIRHAMPEGGVLHLLVSAAVSDGRLHLAVHDDGCGMPDDVSPGTPEGEGLGLRNTRARLLALYSDEQVLVVEPAATGGTVVRASFPARTRGASGSQRGTLGRIHAAA